MANKAFGMSLGGIAVAVFAILALLGMLGDPISLFGFITLGALWWVLIVAGLYLLSVGAMFKGASAGSRRYAKFASMGLAVLFLASAFIFPALQIGPGVQPGQPGAPQAQLTIAEGTVFDFTDFSTDGDGATGVSQIAINSEQLIVTLAATSAASGDTLAPDSFAIDFTLRCTADCTYVLDGASQETPYHARIVGLSDWVIEGNTTTIHVYEKNSDGTWMIAWTDTGSNTIVGFADGGAMNLFSTGESGTFTFSMYFNENGLPTGIPTGEVYTRTAIVEIFSPRGGTSFNVQVDLRLTANPG